MKQMTSSIWVLFLNWYLIEFPLTILDNGKNFLIWAWRYFSIGFFIPRLISPWHRDITSYGRGFELNAWLHAFGWNFISRFIGAILRTGIIAFGLIVEAVILVLVLFCFTFWFAGPALLIYLIATSLNI